MAGAASRGVYDGQHGWACAGPRRVQMDRVRGPGSRVQAAAAYAPVSQPRAGARPRAGRETASLQFFHKYVLFFRGCAGRRGVPTAASRCTMDNCRSLATRHPRVRVATFGASCTRRVPSTPRHAHHRVRFAPYLIHRPWRRDATSITAARPLWRRGARGAHRRSASSPPLSLTSGSKPSARR